MGCDIHILTQKKTPEGYVDLDVFPFENRSYSVFGFLANVRNYSAIPPISDPRGFPPDFVYDEDGDTNWLGDHSYSWLSVQELLDFDYDRAIEDRRYVKQVATNTWDGGATADEGEGRKTTYREFLGEGFFKDLEALRAAGADRIIFGFDN